MLKGAQKRMIVVKTSDSEIFEEAYFVVRGGIEREKPDMVGEANRIIEGCSERRRERISRDARVLVIPLVALMLGTLLGVGITLAVMMIAC